MSKQQGLEVCPHRPTVMLDDERKLRVHDFDSGEHNFPVAGSDARLLTFELCWKPNVILVQKSKPLRSHLLGAAVPCRSHPPIRLANTRHNTAKTLRDFGGTVRRPIVNDDDAARHNRL